MIAIPATDDGKNWARLIINRIEYGRKYCSYSRRLAHEVLSTPLPEPAKRLHLDANGCVQRYDVAPEHEPEQVYCPDIDLA